jgi:nitrogen fixation/metabolism regulation signal transduction histidine kinase
MFKTIELRLRILTLLLIAAVAGATWLLIGGRILLGLLAVCGVIWLVNRLLYNYKKFNKSVIFLLNALENGDYSFSFAESEMSREKRDVNSILNVIKNILIKAREQEIENEKFLSLIVAAIPAGIVIVDERNFVKVANDAALRLLGLNVFTHVKQLAMVDESVLHTFQELVPGRKATVRIADEREERLISLGLTKIRIKRGTLRVVAMHNIAGELEEREMESWIKLIRVMTHEIMNSIAPITSLSETMLTAWEESRTGQNSSDTNHIETSREENPSVRDEEDKRLKTNTIEAFETITSTARGLLSFVESYRRFTGIPKPELRPVNLAWLAEKMIHLASPLLRERGIEVTTRFPDPEITVAADEGQIGQVLGNLLKNATEAILPGQTGGKIEVRISKNNEGEVLLDVVNNGAPIPQDVLPHIFVPFFTTKASGTGIGLSVSRYIMRLHGGNLKHFADDSHTFFRMIFTR